MFTKNEILDIAIQLERNAEKVYREAAAKLTPEDLVAALNWMAEEELKHANWFESQKITEAIPEMITPSDTFNQEFLQQMLQDQSFSLKDIDFSIIQHVRQLFAVFVEFEEDTILFYDLLTSFVEDKEAQHQLQQIIAEEKRHIEQIKTMQANEAFLAPI